MVESTTTEHTEAEPETIRLTADVVAITRVDGQLAILLIRRGWPPYEGCWALPGGHVDVGETTRAAALRELAEETGIEGQDVAEIGVYSEPGRDPRGRYVTVAYRSLLTVATPPVAGDDAAEARWVPLGELDHLPIAFDHRAIIRDATAGDVQED